MKFGILLFTFSIVAFIEAHSQSLGQVLRKAYHSGDSANYYFQEAQKLIKSEADEAEFFLFKSIRATDFGSPDSAVFYGLIAEEKFKILNDSAKLIFVYNNLSKSYQKQGLYEKAISVLFEGLKLAELQKDDAWMGYLYQNISLNYHDFEDYENGVKYGKLAFSKLSNLSNNNGYNIALALNTIAISFDDWDKPDSALFYHFKVFDYKDQIDTLSIGFTYNNIGNTLLKQKKFAQAKSWIEKAIVIARCKLRGANDNPFYYENATNYTNLAAVCYELGEFRQAETAFDSAHFYVTKSNSTEKLRDYNYYQYLFNKKRGNSVQALLFQEEYYKIKEKIFDDSKAKMLAELETKYQAEKKEKELAESRAKILEAENKEKQKTTWLLLTALLAFSALTFSYLIFRQQKLKLAQQKQEFQLKEEISRIETQNKLQEQWLSISRDLHDNIGSQLTFIISSVNNLKFRHRTENQALLSQLNKIGDFATETIVELRDTIWAMNAGKIKFDDLRSRIFNFLEKARKTGNELKTSFEIDETLKEIELTATVGINIYRTIQEAVNNAIKHSVAGNISISIKNVRNENIEISVFDDGRGFDSDEVKNGNGLYNMAKRMEDIGAKFSLETEETKGTKISLLITKEQITEKKTVK